MTLLRSRMPFLSATDAGGGAGTAAATDAHSSGESRATGPAGTTGATGGDPTRPIGTGGTGPTGATGTTPAVEPVTVLIEGKTYVLQDHADKLIGTARVEGKQAGKSEAQQQAELAASRAKGDLEGVVKTLEAQVTDLTAQLAARDLEATRTKVAAATGLVGEHADLVQFITGTDEAEMTAQAKVLAARVLPKAAADTEAGKRGGDAARRAAAETKKPEREKADAVLATNPSWMPHGAVRIPDDM